MRRLVMAVTIAAAALTMSRAATAQELGGYVQAGGGFASATDGTSGDVSAQIGVRASRYVIAFVDVGQVRNLQPSVVQSAIDAAVANLAATNVNVTGSGRGAAFYTVGGVKLLVPTHSVVTPYATAGLGVGHLTPSATFTYNTGSTISGGTATAGQDATTDITTGGYFTVPATQNGLMLRFGGGIDIPVGHAIVADIGYTVSRLSVDTPVTAQGVKFAIGLKF